MEHFETVKITIQDAVAQVTLNRPEVRNAFNPQMVIELSVLFQGDRQCPDTRKVIGFCLDIVYRPKRGITLQPVYRW